MLRVTKSLLIGLIFFCAVNNVSAQVVDTFVVNGDLDKFYPVTFADSGFLKNVPTELQLGRSSVHQDGNLRGSLMAKFRFHVTK